MRYEYFNKKNNKFDIYVVNCGYEDCCSKLVCPPYKSKYYSIYYVSKGCGYYKVNDSVYKVKKGDINMIIRPNESVSYGSYDTYGNWSLCWIGFAGKNAKEYLNMAGIDESTYIKPLSSLNFYFSIKKCFDYAQKNQESISQVKLNSYLLNALTFLMVNEKEEKASVALRQIDRAIEYIERNYMNEISVAGISDHLSLNRSYVYKIFKKHTGMSPEQYVVRYKINKSIELLKEHTLSISEISLAVGFSNQYYFSKVFKKVTGVLPSKYS